MVWSLAITLFLTPWYFWVRRPYMAMPLDQETGHYIGGHAIVGSRLAFARGWHARFCAGAKLIPEIFFSLVYLVHGAERYAVLSRLYISAINYLTGIAVGLLAFLAFDSDWRAYLAGLLVYICLSSEPHYNTYRESSEQFEILPQTASLLLLLTALHAQSAVLAAVAAAIWMASACAIKVTSLVGAFVLFTFVCTAHAQFAGPVAAVIAAACLLYAWWLHRIGWAWCDVRGRLARIAASIKSSDPLRRVVFHLCEKFALIFGVLWRQPLIPLLSLVGFLTAGSVAPWFGWYMLATLATFVAQPRPARHHLMLFWPPMVLLAVAGSRYLVSAGPWEQGLLLVLTAVWFAHNVLRPRLLGAERAYLWSQAGRLESSTCHRNVLLMRGAAALRRASVEQGLLVYGPYSQAHALARAVYSTSMISADASMDVLDPDWQRHLASRLYHAPPGLVLDTQRCFDAAEVRARLGIDYELRTVLPGGFRLYQLHNVDQDASVDRVCNSYQYISRSRLAEEELRMTMRRARQGAFKARSWAVLADRSQTERMARLEPIVQMPLVICTNNPVELLERLPEVDAVGVIDEPAPAWMEKIRQASGGRLIYVPGQFDHPDERPQALISRAGRVLAELDRCGARRVGLYGAGRTAGALTDEWLTSAAPIVAVFDDDPQRQRGSFLNHQVQPLLRAKDAQLDALVVCSQRFEHLMIRRARRLDSQGIVVVGIRAHGCKTLQVRPCTAAL